ncbi:hypothetical protein [Phormidium pseudopriestleyi]|nr:hypothetical protein [Phormidium pseudopriestleyi]
MDSRILPNHRVAAAQLTRDNLMNQSTENLPAPLDEIEKIRQSEL